MHTRSSRLSYTLAAALSLAGAASVAAQSQAGADLPVSRVALFSSGVGYYEHSGKVSGDASIPVSFRVEDVDDVLKSLVIRSGQGGGSPSVSYPSKADEARALKAFRIDLSGNPDAATLLARSRGLAVGVEIAGSPSRRVSGRVMGMESRPVSGAQGGADSGPAMEPYLDLLTDAGLESLRLSSLASFRFADPVYQGDFVRAMEFIAASRDKTRTSLTISLPGTGTRDASFGYVVASPVWKASYRLDLSGTQPFLQGWAAVDNATDRDWRGVVLSLVSGRPVSFIQPLYAPVYLDRPTIPLAIAGTAAARSFDQGFEPEGGPAPEMESMKEMAAAPAPMARSAPMKSAKMSADFAASSLSATPLAVATARAAGDLFEFTIPAPVDLDRGKSALLPLVAKGLKAERVSIYTAGSSRPSLGARLSNTTGMKMPAGPVTVFDGGSYSGDALLDFLNEGDNRLISFGEDLSLTPSESASRSEETVGVALAKGVLVFKRRVSVSKTYSFRNADGRARTVVVEHPRSSGAELYLPAAFSEKTDALFRFDLGVEAGKQASLTVVERSPTQESVALINQSADAFLRYSASSGISPAQRDALSKAADYKRAVDGAVRTAKEIQARRTELSQEQGRLRDNLSALGRESSEGKKIVGKLMDAEAELDRQGKRLEEARKAQQDAQASFEAYLAGLSL